MSSYLNLFTVPRTDARQINAVTYNDYYMRLRLLATSVFDWQGLPDSVNARYLEQSLFMTGKALFFKDPALGFMALQCTPSSAMNFYLEPTEYIAVSLGYSEHYNMDNAVLIRNNYDMEPTDRTIRLFCERLTTAERIIDVNLKAQRTPLFLVCTEKQRLTMKNIFAQYEGNEPLIIGDKSLNPELIRAVNTQAPYLVDKMMLYKNDIWNEAMTYLGINNANTDKRERLITDEAQANNQLIATSATVMLMTRQAAAEQINKMFGLGVSVSLRETAALEGVQVEDPQDEAPAAEKGSASE